MRKLSLRYCFLKMGYGETLTCGTQTLTLNKIRKLKDNIHMCQIPCEVEMIHNIILQTLRKNAESRTQKLVYIFKVRSLVSILLRSIIGYSDIISDGLPVT